MSYHYEKELEKALELFQDSLLEIYEGLIHESIALRELSIEADLENEGFYEHFCEVIRRAPISEFNKCQLLTYLEESADKLVDILYTEEDAVEYDDEDL